MRRAALVALIVSGIAAELTRGATPRAPQERRPEATSSLGTPLYSGTPSPEALAHLEGARAELEKSPKDADAIIWVGRRLGYLQRFREAIDTFSRGIELHRTDARLYRHRGHRYLSVREFDKAIEDLTKASQLIAGKADQVEPDGQPNARKIPTSTLNSNIYYHLGLGYYFKGDFANALKAYQQCATFSKNPDMTVATSHWLYMILRRIGREAEAKKVLEPITAGMDIIENGSYHKLLLMYKGDENPEALLSSARAKALDAVTVGYGVGNWHLYNGRQDRAMKIFTEIVEKNRTQWPAFGYIAAETEMARLRKLKR